MDYEKPDRKEAILNAAEQLFSETGYDSASTRAIAAKAGVNMAMLNYYFGSKDGLYKALLERRLISTEDPDPKEQQESCAEELGRWIDAYIENLLSDIPFQKLISRELSLQQRSDMTDLITDGLVRNAASLKRILFDGVKKGDFRETDLEMTIVSVLGTGYYIVNSTHIASKIIGRDLRNPEIMQNDVKPRLKYHLASLLNAFLKTS